MQHLLHLRLLTAVLLGLLLSACGDGNSNITGGSGTGTVNIALTDAPVDDVTQVWIEFYAVTLKPADGEQMTFEFDPPRSIDLRALTDGKIEVLLDEEVPVGDYDWIKLHVNAAFDDIFDSYVVEDGGGQVELRIPSDRLKLGNHFTVSQGGALAFIIEWNLRMGLKNPPGQPGYMLQPSLRITDASATGTIAGTVDANLLPPIDTDCSSDPNTGDGNVVYVFAGADVIPDDIDGTDPEPLTTADVRLNDDSGNQEYMVPFLPAGEYTLAFTCQGADDVIPDPEDPGLPADDPIEFTDGINATVTEGATTIVDFVAP